MRLSTVSIDRPFDLARDHEPGEHRLPVEQDRVAAREALAVVAFLTEWMPDALQQRLEVLADRRLHRALSYRSA